MPRSSASGRAWSWTASKVVDVLERLGLGVDVERAQVALLEADVVEPALRRLRRSRTRSRRPRGRSPGTCCCGKRSASSEQRAAAAAAEVEERRALRRGARSCPGRAGGCARRGPRARSGCSPRPSPRGSARSARTGRRRPSRKHSTMSSSTVEKLGIHCAVDREVVGRGRSGEPGGVLGGQASSAPCRDRARRCGRSSSRRATRGRSARRGPPRRRAPGSSRRRAPRTRRRVPCDGRRRSSPRARRR